MDLVGDERGERGDQLRDLDQAVAQGGERCRVAVPEAPAVEPHVPVGELVDVVGDRPTRGGAVEVVHAVDHRLRQPLQPRDRPPVEVRLRARRSPRPVPGPRRWRTGRRTSRCSTASAGTGAATRRSSRPRSGSPPTVAGCSADTSETHRLPGCRRPPTGRRRCRGSSTSSGPRGRGSGRGRRSSHSSSDRRAGSTRRAASRTSRGSGPGPRRCSPLGSARRTGPRSRTGSETARTASRPESNQASMTSSTRRISRPHDLAVDDDLVDERPVQVVGHVGAALAQLGDRAGAEPLARSRPTRIPRPAAACPSSARARAPSRRFPRASLPEAPGLDVVGPPADALVERQHPVANVGGADVPARLRVIEQRCAAAPAVG